MLRVVAGLGVDQVAAIMGKRPGTVRVLTHRGLRRLAERLGTDRIWDGVAMGPDDASSAEMRRLFPGPDADPLAVDEATVERLLSGELAPEQAPPGYAAVAKLLAATAAAPRHEELAGQAAALAELQADDPGPGRRHPPDQQAKAAASGRAGGRGRRGRARDRWGRRRGHRPSPGPGAGGGPEHPGHRRRSRAGRTHTPGPARGTAHAADRIRRRRPGGQASSTTGATGRGPATTGSRVSRCLDLEASAGRS